MAVLTALVAGLNAGAFTPTNLRFGQISDFTLTDTVNLEWNEADFGKAPVLGEGEKFAVVRVELKPDRSIGKYDYTLSGGKCLAMAKGDAPFSPTDWQEIATDVPVAVSLLYKVNEADAPFTFSFDYQVTSLPADERHVILGLVEAPPAAEETAPAEGSAEGAPAEDAIPADGADAPPAEAQPAAEATPEPAKAAPEPTVEKEKTAEPAKTEPAKPEPAKAAPAKKEPPKAAPPPAPKEEEEIEW